MSQNQCIMLGKITMKYHTLVAYPEDPLLMPYDKVLGMVETSLQKCKKKKIVLNMVAARIVLIMPTYSHDPILSNNVLHHRS